MPRTFQKAEPATVELIEAVAKKFHKRLIDDEVTFTAVMAYAARDSNDEVVGHSLTVRGAPAAACVRATSLLERTIGMADVLLQFDGDKWPDWSDERRRALIDHELTHIIIRRDDASEVKLDDRKRPLITMRAHDWEIVGFTEVVRRHGPAAFEATAVQQVAAHLVASVQLKFEFSDGVEDPADMELRTA